MGNLEAKRDWGFAGDYVEAMWLMLQQEVPDDYVIATGESYSVRDFVVAVGKELGIEISWKGEGLNEVGVDQKGNTVIKIEEKYFRPHEVDFLQGDATKARTKLGWKSKVTFTDLVKMMVASDLKLIAGRSDDQAEDD
jgi:GDPmannose 4,6-dehydratase